MLMGNDKGPSLNNKDWSKILNAGEFNHVIYILRTELKRLGELPSAGAFEFPKAAESLDLGSLAFIEPFTKGYSGDGTSAYRNCCCCICFRHND